MSAPDQAGKGGRLFILLPVHNRREVTVRFVQALARQTRRDFQLVLIDDGSTDGTADAVRAILPETEVLTGTGNWWWAGSLDQGGRHLATRGVADDDVLLLINDDLSVADDFLEQALAEFGSGAGTLLLARQMDAKTGAEVGLGGGVHADVDHLRFAATDRAGELNCLPTRGLFLRWGDWRKAGGFRPERLPHYLSDYEFTHRAGRQGLRLEVARKASVGVQLDRSGESWETIFRLPRRQRLRLLLSPRFKDNPVTWSAFVQLTASPGRRPYLWVKIWLHFLFMTLRCAVLSPRPLAS